MSDLNTFKIARGREYAWVNLVEQSYTIQRGHTTLVTVIKQVTLVGVVQDERHVLDTDDMAQKWKDIRVIQTGRGYTHVFFISAWWDGRQFPL